MESARKAKINQGTLLTEISVAPGVDGAVLGQGHRLGVPAATGDLDDPLADESFDELGLEAGGRVAVPESAVLAEAPGVELAVAGDGGRVSGAAGDVPDPYGLEGLDESGLVEGRVVPVAELAVLPLAPREHLAVMGEGERVLTPRVDRHLLDYVLAEEGYELGLADAVVVAEAEASVRPLAAGVQFALLAHYEEGLAST
jgi:hypothetical protein